MSEQGIDIGTPGGDRTVLSVFGPSPLLQAWHNWQVGESINRARRQMFALGAFEEPTMTEAQWLASTDSAAMLGFINGETQPEHLGGRLTVATDRKLRLFCCACCRLAGTKPETVDRHEKYGVSLDDERISDADWAQHWTEEGTSKVTLAVRADLLRHIIGTPHRPLLSRPCGECEAGKVWFLNMGTMRVGDKEVAKIKKMGKCPSCSGRGHTPISPPTEKCGRCKGAGKRKHVDSGPYGYGPRTVEYEPCSDCHGTGRLSSFPALVVQLAQAVYDGDQDATGPLHDALLDNGEEWALKLADHFTLVENGPGVCLWHPRGCAWLAVILGQE